IHSKALDALKEGLSEDLQKELETLTIPLEGTPSESEIRLAQAQLVGWLEGLFHGIQAALWAQHMQTRAQLDEMRRRGLPPGTPEAPGSHGPGQSLEAAPRAGVFPGPPGRPSPPDPGLVSLPAATRDGSHRLMPRLLPTWIGHNALSRPRSQGPFQR